MERAGEANAIPKDSGIKKKNKKKGKKGKGVKGKKGGGRKQ